MPVASPRRHGRRLVFAFRGATARIHAPVFWRALYAAWETRAVIRLAALGFRIAGRLGHARPVELLDRVLPIFETGWPHHLGTPWVNLNVQRLHRRIVRELEGSKPGLQRRPRASPDRLRLGVVGILEGAFFFTRRLFEARPGCVDVVAFDLGSGTSAAQSYVGPLVEAYHHFSLDQIEELGGAINDAQLDVVLADVRKPAIYALLDLVETPCVALLCAEVYLRYHPAVSFHLYPFQQADYFPLRHRLYCGTTRT